MFLLPRFAGPERRADLGNIGLLLRRVLRPVYPKQKKILGLAVGWDLAWQYSIGDRRVVIAVLDSGIRWHHDDLLEKYALNRVELEAASDVRCLPQPSLGFPGDAVDTDGDGVLSLNDYFFFLSDVDADALRAEIDQAGNQNGVAEAGDLIVMCSDGTDDDKNGYIDDISGWDFLHHDNDPFDDTDYGHGTGEARDSMGTGNNGVGQCGHLSRMSGSAAESFG